MVTKSEMQAIQWDCSNAASMLELQTMVEIIRKGSEVLVGI